MKIRTEAGLFDFIDAQLIWRKKELTQFKFLLDDAIRREDRRIAVLRSAVTLLYAHWEGFIKSSGLAYLEYVAAQRLRFDELAPSFLALAARKLLSSAANAKQIHVHVEVVNFFSSGLSEPSHLPYKDGISTRSNLSSDVLREITETLGLDFSPYETKAHLIDEALVAARNTIAHGEYLVITPQRYDEVSREVLGMMEAFRTQVQNAIVLRMFRKQDAVAASGVIGAAGTPK